VDQRSNVNELSRVAAAFPQAHELSKDAEEEVEYAKLQALLTTSQP